MKTFFLLLLTLSSTVHLYAQNTFGLTVENNAYINGAIETKEILLGCNTEISKFTFTTAFAPGEDFLAIAPNIGETRDFDFPNELKFWGDGLLSKEVANADTAAFSVYNNDSQNTVFLIKGDGEAFAKGMHIKLPPFPDYVFAKDYNLLSLSELEFFIKTHHRLPNMPSAEEVAKNGVDIGTLEVQQTEKIEELTLYVIELSKRVEKLEKENTRLRKKRKNRSK